MYRFPFRNMYFHFIVTISLDDSNVSYFQNEKRKREKNNNHRQQRSMSMLKRSSYTSSRLRKQLQTLFHYLSYLSFVFISINCSPCQAQAIIHIISFFRFWFSYSYSVDCFVLWYALFGWCKSLLFTIIMTAFEWAMCQCFLLRC